MHCSMLLIVEAFIDSMNRNELNEPTSFRLVPRLVQVIREEGPRIERGWRLTERLDPLVVEAEPKTGIVKRIVEEQTRTI